MHRFVPLRLLALAAIIFAGWSSAPARAADVSGVWLTQAGDAKVQVSRCGAALCGRVVWLREPNDPATGKPQRDDKNENPALRTRPIVGLVLFIDMRATGPNRWSGRIYNADDGKTYVSNVSFGGGDTLDVQGCVGAFCGGETWTRSRR